MTLRYCAPSLALVLLFVACGGTTGGQDTVEPTGESAGPTDTPSEASAAGAPDVVLPFVGLVAPSIAPTVASLELATEDEELSFELAPPEEDLDEMVGSMLEIVRAMGMSEDGAVRSVEIGGRPGKLLTVTGQDRGTPVGLGFAIVDTDDGRQARLTYMIRRRGDASAELERVIASFSPTRPASPAPGFRVVGIGGYWFEAPERATVARASLMYPDESELDVRVLPRSANPADDPLAQATTQPLNTVRRIERIERAETTLLGTTATRATWDVVLEGGPTIPEQAVEVDIRNRTLLFVRASRLPPTIDFAAVLTTIARTEP